MKTPPSDFTGGIILFAKRPGLTSFSSLYTIKRALGARKVGHTGTLDSFASGLLVVCAGNLTPLSSRITEMCKTYQAVIKFGVETDTLEWTGRVTRTAPLPSREAVEESLARFIGKIEQTPPAFSAVHVDGKRASDIARSGGVPKIAPREIEVFSSSADEWLFDENGKVSAARVSFSVSKGAYVRCLARDIGAACGSAAHLAGLRRTSVGDFRLEDAAGFSLLAPFSIQSAFSEISARKATGGNDGCPRGGPDDEREIFLREETLRKIMPMSEALALRCGFAVVHLAANFTDDARHGRPLKDSMFDERSVPRGESAVFSSGGEFLALIRRDGPRVEYEKVFS